MAEIAKVGTPSLCSPDPPPWVCFAGLYAGEAIVAGDNCYVKASDGLVYRCTGAAVAAAARVRGQAPGSADIGEPVTLTLGQRYYYGAGLTPGADYYLSGTNPGGLADAASTGGTVPIAYAIDATRVQFLFAN